MTVESGDFGALAAAFAYIVGAIVLLGIGVGLGMVATRIIRRDEEPEEDEKEPGDRHG
jgi:hypothetical protein